MPAKQLEVILKKHLDAVEHVMVVASRKEFLSCMVTLKTKGSQAAARGEDPASMGPSEDELAQGALELAQANGSKHQHDDDVYYYNCRRLKLAVEYTAYTAALTKNICQHQLTLQPRLEWSKERKVKTCLKLHVNLPPGAA